MERQLVYKSGSVTIYRIFDNIGLFYFGSDVKFSGGINIGNLYKYYWSDLEIVNGFNISEVAGICNMWTSIILKLTNSNHHAFCELSVHGMSQCVGDSTWKVQGIAVVALY